MNVAVCCCPFTFEVIWTLCPLCSASIRFCAVSWEHARSPTCVETCCTTAGPCVSSCCTNVVTCSLLTVAVVPALTCEVVWVFWFVDVLLDWAPNCELLVPDAVLFVEFGFVVEKLLEDELVGALVEEGEVIDVFVEELNEPLALALPFALAEPDMPVLGVVALLGAVDCMLLLLEPNWLLD